MSFNELRNPSKEGLNKFAVVRYWSSAFLSPHPKPLSPRLTVETVSLCGVGTSLIPPARNFLLIKESFEKAEDILDTPKGLNQERRLLMLEDSALELVFRTT